MFTVKLKLLYIDSLYYFFTSTKDLWQVLTKLVTDWTTHRPTDCLSDGRIRNNISHWIPHFNEVGLYCLHRQIDVYPKILNDALYRVTVAWSLYKTIKVQ